MASKLVVLSMLVALLSIGAYFYKKGDSASGIWTDLETVGEKAVFFVSHDLLPLLGLDKFVQPSRRKSDTLLLPEELKIYDGSKKSPGLYLAICGQVFDVKKGAKHYAPGGGYDFFAAIDGTRAYVSGEFTETGISDDISDFTPMQIYQLKEWLNFFHKDYIYVGKVVGRFYDSEGKETDQVKLFDDGLIEAERIRKLEKDDKEMFPPCNSEWSQAKGSRVWCTEKSGGISRDWVGVPRKYFQVGKPKHRCACIKTTGPPSDDPNSNQHNNRGDLDNPQLHQYLNCDPKAVACKITTEDK